MGREVRCQAVIVRGEEILVLRQYNYKRKEEYWMLPGGGLEEGEREQQCIIREVKEETGLEVQVKEVLFDTPGDGRDVYKRYVTFLCSPLAESIERVGHETVSYRKILELVWVSINEENKWDEYLLREQFYPSMKDIKNKLMSVIK